MAIHESAERESSAGDLLVVRDLEVEFPTGRGVAHAVRGVDLTIGRSEIVGIVGESGSGKSVTAAAVMGTLRPPGRMIAGEILWKGQSVVPGADAAIRRGKDIALIPQEPLRSLNPLAKVGKQIAEVLRFHRSMSRSAARVEAIALLASVGIAAPERRARQYPHELSGGMCQRVLIALALAVEPQLLIADEPTTALDVTVQAQIVELLHELRDRIGLALLFITHDLGLVADLCDSVVVMYAGMVMEHGSVREVLEKPVHPYTRALLRSTPLLTEVRARLPAIVGQPPDATAPPTGCPFHTRCSHAVAVCSAERPTLEPISTRGGEAACWVSIEQRETPPA